jgi:DNA recombination protein Rad52
MFSPEQIAKLEAKLDPANVKPRRGNDGREVSYVEGWHIIDEANRVFGFGNWDCETVEMHEVHPTVSFTPPPTRERPHPKEQMVACYAARVRITVWSRDGSQKRVREGYGAHRSFALTFGEAVDNAIKGAETDALKRAFRTFGNVFGLALYDKSGRNVGRDEPRQLAQADERPMAPIDQGFDDTPAQPSISRRALATVAKPNGQGPPRSNGPMRY